MPVMEEPLSRVAQYVHRIVFGEGPIPEKPLSRIEWLLAYAIEKGISGIKEGYYYNGQFYKDEEHTELLEPTEGNLYYDKNGKKIYLYDGTSYTKVGAGSWDEIEGKPFESVGSGLHIDEDGVLSAEAVMETFVFKGYVSATEPTGTIKAGAFWYQSAAMPTTFPIQVKTYNGTAWGTDTTNYTPESLEMWANLGDGHGYYWFGNDWNIIDVNVEYDNVTIGVNALGQLEVKTAYRLPASTTSDDGKFLRNVNGAAAWVAVPNAENNSF